ncbi:hypothetical protein ACN38_g7297 [Penicillium nordicum]|uniref:Uncharacterized protein n=1 Tax=Penicillium nordicum TaxID=229535 RepID=A0A0M8P788_9EURO|nr:hypothetical protein ACN38_g7297 [Penicillium nordicum]
MLCGVKFGHSKPQDLPRWNAHSTCQWLDDFEDPKTTRPHIKLLTLTGAKAKEHELLHGELAPIANVLYCRLEQPEFEDTSLFPVLVISLFGPRHGRLLQAKFDNSAYDYNIRDCAKISRKVINRRRSQRWVKRPRFPLKRPQSWSSRRHLDLFRATYGIIKHM